MPKLESVKFSKGRRDLFQRWMHNELHNTIGDRGELEQIWADNLVQWRAKLPKGSKDFPWPGASNTEFPLTAIHSDPVYSDFIQTTYSARDRWSITPRKSELVDASNAVRKALRAIDEDFLHMRNVDKRGFLDLTVQGTEITKTHWVHRQKIVQDYDEAGDVTTRSKTVSHPKYEHIPLQHFYIPANSWEIDPDAPVGGARWVAHKFFRRPNQLREMAASDDPVEPEWNKEAVELVLSWEHADTDLLEGGGSDREDPIDRKIQEEDSYQPFDDKTIELYEIWARYDVDGDGIDEDLVIIWYQGIKGEILRISHNPFLHGKRPFNKDEYLPGFGFYGIGMAEIDEWSQDLTTKLLNAQVDNVTLTNTRMYGAPYGSSMEPGTPIYPGKVVGLQPGEEIQEIRLGDIYPSLPATIEQVMQFAEMRTGVNEVRQGNLTNLPSRTPASSLFSATQQGNKRFDMILSNFRVSRGNVGLRILQMLAQYWREDQVRWETYFRKAIGDEDAAKLFQVFELGPSRIEEGFSISAKATSPQSNKEVEKQNFVGLIQLTVQIYSGLIQTAQFADPSLVQPTAAAAYSAGVELLQRLLEQFDIQNTEEYLPSPEITSALQQQLQGGGAGGLGGLGGSSGASPLAAGANPLLSILGGP